MASLAGEHKYAAGNMWLLALACGLAAKGDTDLVKKILEHEADHSAMSPTTRALWVR